MQHFSGVILKFIGKSPKIIIFSNSSNIFKEFLVIFSKFSCNFSKNFQKLLHKFPEMFLQLYRSFPTIFLQFFQNSLKITRNFY